MSLLQITNVAKSFGSLDVLKNISFSVEEHEVIALIGASGSGKSTLLRTINLLENIDKGDILFNNISILSHKNINELRSQIGMVFQSFNLFPHLSALENCMLALTHVKKLKKHDATLLAKHYLSKVGLADRLDFYPAKLSGGQQQRVAIARALCLEPKVLLFDEPTSALDPLLVNEVLSIIKLLAKDGMTMLIVTHEMDFAKEVSHRTIFMKNGEIRETNQSALFFSNPQTDCAKAFLSKVQAKNE